LRIEHRVGGFFLERLGNIRYRALKRAEASSTLRSNSVIHILPEHFEGHASVAVTRRFHYPVPPPSGQSGRIIRHVRELMLGFREEHSF
jgi:hypothetical protein